MWPHNDARFFHLSHFLRPFIQPVLPSSGLSLAIMRGDSSANRLVKLWSSATVHYPWSDLLTKRLRLPVFVAVMKSGRLEACFSLQLLGAAPLGVD